MPHVLFGPEVRLMLQENNVEEMKTFLETLHPATVAETLTGDLEADIIANTQKFTSVIEDYVRKYPEQWLWVHRRWKTRPEGEPPLY